MTVDEYIREHAILSAQGVRALVRARENARKREHGIGGWDYEERVIDGEN